MNNVHTLGSIGQRNNRQNPDSNIQILNPNVQPQDPQANICKKLFPFFSIKKLCFWIIVINFAMYLYEIIYLNYVHKDKNWNCTIYNLGAKFTPSIRYHFQIYRLFLPIILHGSFAHVFLNNVSILLLGFYAENFLGFKRFFILYITSGFYSSLLSAVVSSKDLSVGASGAIMGINGFYIVFYLINYARLDQNDKKFFLILVCLTAMNLFQTKTSDGQMIDIYGHIGGFICGFVLSPLIFGDHNIVDEYILSKLKIIKLSCLAFLIIYTAILVGLIYGMNIEQDLLGEVGCK